MAHLVTGYAGHAHITSADDGAFNAAFFGGGQYVMEFGNCFEGSIINNNTVRILDGDGLMYGRHFRIEPNSYEDMAITTGTAGTNRIDLICMTYEKNASDETEKCYLQVIKGTETTGTAVAPAYTDGNILEGATFNQMPLYKVTIEGVVLKKITPMFEKLQTYKALAEYYASVFERRCDEKLENLPIDALTPEDVVDNLLSVSANLPLSANQGRILNEKTTNGIDNINNRLLNIANVVTNNEVSFGLASGSETTSKNVFVAPASGIYFIDAYAIFAHNANGNRFFSLGSVDLDGMTVAPVNGNSTAIKLNTVVYMSKGQQFFVNLRQTSGSVLNVTVKSRYSYLPL